MSLNFKYTTALADYENADQATINYLTAGDVNRNKQFSDQIYGLIFIIVFVIFVMIIAAIVDIRFNIFSFALGIVFYIFITRYKVRQIKNKLTPKPDCSLFGEHEMTLGQEAFTVNTHGSSNTTHWDVVTDIQESDDYFFIFMDSLRGVYIPKRGLETEGLARDIRTYINARVSSVSNRTAG